MGSLSSARALAIARFLVLASLLLAGTVYGSCNFAASCANENLSGTVLSASCAARNGNSKFSSLDLNAKISNNDGRLQCPGANFGASCFNTGLSGGHTLTSVCRSRSGANIVASLDLNNCILNNDGILQFCV